MGTPLKESDYEKERGKPMPSLNHGVIQMRLGSALMRYQSDYTIASELTLELGDLIVTPDLCVYPKLDIDLLHDQTRMTEPPLIAVEIPSAAQSQQEMIDKIQAMLEAGVASCWFVQPAIRAVTVFSGGREFETFTEGNVHDAATGIEVALDDIFPGE